MAHWRGQVALHLARGTWFDIGEDFEAEHEIEAAHKAFEYVNENCAKPEPGDERIIRVYRMPEQARYGIDYNPALDWCEETLRRWEISVYKQELEEVEKQITKVKARNLTNTDDWLERTGLTSKEKQLRTKLAKLEAKA